MSYQWSKVDALSAFGNRVKRITNTKTGQLIWENKNDISNVNISLEPSSYSHSGSSGDSYGPDEPTTTVKIGDKTLVAGTDYIVRYSNNSGTISETKTIIATCTICGEGKYIGSKSTDFNIDLIKKELDSNNIQ